MSRLLQSLPYCLCAVVTFWNAAATARKPPKRDQHGGALDASLIVIVRQKESNVFQIEEAFLGHKRVGSTIRLIFKLSTVQRYGPDKVEPIVPQTRILLFLQPKKDDPKSWAVCSYGHCFYWIHHAENIKRLRMTARKMVAFRRSWEKARDISDASKRVKALWPFLWDNGSRVSRRTSDELKKTAPVAGDFIAERMDKLRHYERMSLIVEASEYGGQKLHDALKRHLRSQQGRYERFLKDRGPDAKDLIEDWNNAPQEIKRIWGDLYYGLAGLSGFSRRKDLAYIRELAKWAVKYRFKQTCDAALNAFRKMPDKANLPLIDAIWKEFTRRPYKGNALSAFDVTRALRTHRYPETVPILAQLLGDKVAGNEARGFLREIVGQDLGAKPQPWLEWYKRQRAK